MGSNAIPPGPIIDCSTISHNFEDFAKKLGSGIEHSGFVYLINHEFKKDAVEKLDEKTLEFFKLSKDVKTKYKMLDPLTNYWGYTPGGVERVGDNEGSTSKDSKESFDFCGPDLDEASKYPTEIPGLKGAVDDFRSPFQILTRNLLRAFATYLNMEDQLLIEMHGFDYKSGSAGVCSIIRSIYYSPVTSGDPQKAIRMGEHCDLGTFTYLFQDNSGGLEVKTKNGDWIPVPPIPGSIVLNTGILLESWSGGKLMAVPHRVRALSSNCNKPRQSLAFFVMPDNNYPLASKVPVQPNWTSAYIDENEHSADFIQRRLKGFRFY